MSEEFGRQSFAVRARDLLRNSLLDAARELAVARGWAATTLTEVARLVGVSRQTLYTQYPTKEALGFALVGREVDRFLALVDTAFDEHPHDPIGGIEVAVSALLRGAADDVFAKSVLSGVGSEQLLPLITSQAQPVHDVAAERVLAYLRAGRPQLPAFRAELLADSVVRLALSHVIAASGPPEVAARGIAMLVEPFVFAASAPSVSEERP